VGEVRFDDRSGTVRVASAPPFDSPIYAAGLDLGDEIREVDGTRIRSVADVTTVLARRRPGNRIAVVFADRSGRQRTSSITLSEDPAFELVPVERAGGALTTAQRTFRERWVN
jgi:S1-C subfamily serine protease